MMIKCGLFVRNGNSSIKYFVSAWYKVGEAAEVWYTNNMAQGHFKV